MLNFLVVDDSTMAIRNISKHIKNLGHNVVGEATSASDAILKYKKLQPDMVTMDITMPELDGISDGIIAVKKILSFDKDANIIMVTSHGQESLVSQALQAGAKGYILKPTSEENLAKTIGTINQNYHQDTVNSDEYLL
jgi:two-component system, chemotaxis family, chemotaxis protein CheY